MNNNLETLRELNNLKAKDIAAILKINKSIYSEWENNKTPIPTKRMVELANFYHVNIDYLLNLGAKKEIVNLDTNINLIEIGKRLKEARTELDMSLRELGEKLNCSFSSLAAYERGEKLINGEILISLAKLSKYSTDYILGRKDYKYIFKNIKHS